MHVSSVLILWYHCLNCVESRIFNIFSGCGVNIFPDLGGINGHSGRTDSCLSYVRGGMVYNWCFYC